MPAPVLLQLCPNDLAPFAGLCQLYAQAAASIGAHCITVYLDQRAAQPIAATQHAGDVHYLLSAQAAPASNRVLRQRLDEFLHHKLGDTKPQLALCHRHQSYRVLRSSAYLANTNLVLAHEYHMLKRWQRKLDRLLFARNFQFAGIAPAVAAQLAQVTGETLVLPNGIDVEALAQRLKPRANAQQALGAAHWPLKSPAVIVGVVGRLHRKKRPQLALEGFAEWVSNSSLAAQLLFVGDGELGDPLQQQNAHANLNAHFCGFVNDAPSALLGLDVLLLTSSSAEAFGMVALEAMVAGVPVVAPRLPGPVSVLGDLGIYFDDLTDQAGRKLAYPAGNPANLSTGVAAALDTATALTQSDELKLWQERAAARVQEQFSIAATAARLQPWLATAG